MERKEAVLKVRDLMTENLVSITAGESVIAVARLMDERKISSLLVRARGQIDPFDFEVVSPLVDEIIENRRSKTELIEMGYPHEIVEDTHQRFRTAEYKR